MCRHEVGPPRTQEERERLLELARQEEMDLNLWYGLMLDEFANDEEATREATQQAINQALLEDAASNPLQFGDDPEPVNTPSIASGSSNTKAPMIAVQDAHAVVREIGDHEANGIIGNYRTGEGYPRPADMRLPPMVGPDLRMATEENGYPSMDDPSRIFDNGRAVGPPPAPPAPEQVTIPEQPPPPNFQNYFQDPFVPPLVEQPPPPPPNPQIQDPNPFMGGWYQPQIQPQIPHPPLPIPQPSNPFSGPFIAPVSLRPTGYASTPPTIPFINTSNPIPPPPLPGARHENPLQDPFNIVNGARMGTPQPSSRPLSYDFSHLFEDPNHPQNRSRNQSLPSLFSAPTLWNAPLFAQPPPLPPPIIEPPPPAPTPPAEERQLISAPPPIVPLTQVNLLPPIPPPPMVPLPPFVSMGQPPSPSVLPPNPLEIPLRIPSPPPPPQPDPPITMHHVPIESNLPPLISYSDLQPYAHRPPTPPPPPPAPLPEITSPEAGAETGGGEIQLPEFKPAYLPLIGIAALFFYAFSTLGAVFLLGILGWYSYRYPHGLNRKSAP